MPETTELLTRDIQRSDMIRCVLCENAPCSSACREIDPASLLRSIWFDNEKTAARRLPEQNPCLKCQAPCEKACVRSGQVPIQMLMTRLHDEVRPFVKEALPEGDELLKTDFCGVPMENPFILGSSVVASTYDMCARAFEAGWGGVSFKTVCSLDIHEASPRFSAIKGDNGTILGFKNIEQLSDHSVKENMEIFRRLKYRYPNRLILASIMGKDEEEWESLARECEENGADAVELNFSCPNMMEGGLGSDIGQVPELVERFTAAAKRGTKIPVIAKLTPNVARMSPAAEAAVRGGADGVAAINTIKSVMDLNPHTYVSSPSVRGMSAVGGYSGAAVKPVGLRFITELGQNQALKGKHISALGGIENWTDALDYILLGADSLQVCTAVMQYGYRIIDDLRSGLSQYMAEKGFTNIREFKGLGLDTVSQTTDVLERDTIVLPMFDRTKCIGCGRCEISCADGGHQAVRLDQDRRPVLNGKACVGCHLCLIVCPQGAIRAGRKRFSRQKSAE